MTNLITILLITNLTATGHGGKVRERDWQIAANEQHFHGQLEVVNSGGRCDIVNHVYAIEVDSLKNTDEGIEQARRYAKALGKKPAIAIIMPEKPSTLTITNPPIRTYILTPSKPTQKQ